MIKWKHPFILHRGKWLGTGSVRSNQQNKKSSFTALWNVEEEKNEAIHCSYIIKIGEKIVRNKLRFYNIDNSCFSVLMENEEGEQAVGSGVVDKKTIAWEFCQEREVQSFEVYTLVDDGHYTFHAEYATDDLSRTIFDGELKKS